MLTFKQYLLEEVKKSKEINFEYHAELNPEIWKGDKLRPEVRKKALEIAKEFLNSFPTKLKVIDIYIPGSLANYNWTKKSDFDLHIIIDPVSCRGINVDDYFKAKGAEWKTKHNISIRGFKVEVFIEPKGTTHESSAEYSIESDKWIKKPKHIKDLEIDEDEIEKTVRNLQKKIRILLSKNANPKEIEKLKEKIRVMRERGLYRTKKGEFSVGNLAFKALRSKGDLDRLTRAKRSREDEKLSLD